MHWDFNVILGKQKTPGAIHILLWFELWIAQRVFCFPWGKQKTPGGISLGVFYFPRIIKTPNNRIYYGIFRGSLIIWRRSYLSIFGVGIVVLPKQPISPIPKSSTKNTIIFGLVAWLFVTFINIKIIR